MSQKSDEVRLHLSRPTLDVIRNFSAINLSMYFEPGNALWTSNEGATVFGYVSDLDIEFPVEFGIFDTGKFLASVDMMNSCSENGCDLVFYPEKDYVDIRPGAITIQEYPGLDFSGGAETDESSSVIAVNDHLSARIYFCERDMVRRINTKVVKEFLAKATEQIRFELSWADIVRLKKAQAVLQHDWLAIELDESSNLVLAVTDPEEKESNRFQHLIPKHKWSKGAETDISDEFSLLLDMNRLQMLSGSSYKFVIGKKLIVMLFHQGRELVYLTALEQQSKF